VDRRMQPPYNAKNIEKLSKTEHSCGPTRSFHQNQTTLLVPELQNA